MLRRLAFLVLVALIAAFGAQQGGFSAAACGGGCSETCPDDVGTHHCPPGCTACVCVGFAMALGGQDGMTSPDRPVVARVSRRHGPEPADPTIDAIFHVPRAIVG